MIKLFDKYGAYNYTSFMGSSGTWSLHGSEISEKKTKIEFESDIPKSILRVIDTFKRKEDNVFKEFERWQVMKQFALGNIKPILETEVKINKEINKKQGRVL